MSNGTRIDPEEREPRAIKLRQPKHTGRKIVLAVLSVILIVALGGGVYAFVEYGPDFGFTSVITKKPASSETEEPSLPSEPEIPEEPESVPEPDFILVEEPVSEQEPPRQEPYSWKDSFWGSLFHKTIKDFEHRMKDFDEKLKKDFGNWKEPTREQQLPEDVELPWEDDETLRVALFVGKRLVSGHPARNRIEFCWEGPAMNVYSDCSVTCGEVSGNVWAGDDVSCDGVGGSVSAGGDVSCDYVNGYVDATGDVDCETVNGNVDAGGDVSCGTVNRDVKAGGDVDCGDVLGNLNAGGDVSCGDVQGNISTGGDVDCGHVEGFVSAGGDVTVG